MKLDKETLLKHRFWIALGAYVVLWLLVLVLMPIQIGASATAKRTEYNNAKTAVEKIKTPKTDFANPDWVAPLKKKEDDLKNRKVGVWQAAWETQKELMTWPADPDNIAPLDRELKKAYFLDPTQLKDNEWRQRYASTLYAPQYAEFKNAIFPAYYNGGSYETVLRPIPVPAGWSNMPPDSDECWFAQEDLWVKRDLIGAIRAAIDTPALFKPDPIDAKKESLPAGASAWYRFHNDNWEITLVLEPDKNRQLTVSARSTIKNINLDRRRLPVAAVGLEIAQVAKSGAVRGPHYLQVEGEPLEWNKTAEIKKSALVDTFKANEPLEVKQVFNWYTSPVKRLDRVELGTRLAESHRMSKYTLQTKSSGGAKDAAAAPPAPAEGGLSGGNMPNYTSGTGGEGRGGPNGGAAAAAVGVERNRYIDLSDQVRRMPVAMVLVVDQARIPDVLTALANSRLHIWVAQWEWQHVQGVQPPPKAEPPSGEEGSGAVAGAGAERGEGNVTGRQPPTAAMPPVGSSSGKFSGPRPGGEGPGGRQSGMGSAAGPRPGGSSAGGLFRPPGLGGMGGGFSQGFYNGSPETAGLEQEDPNLVELTVYGIASLYERFPPK
jgi:hypothetical protein